MSHPAPPSHPAIVVFTGRPLAEILAPDIRGSGDWRLDLARAEAADFLVCTRNRNSPDFPPAPEPHRAAFLIGRKKAIVPSPGRPDRWLIRISEYSDTIIPNIWGKYGQIHLRYPVWYTTLEDLGIDLATLPPFRPLPKPSQPLGLSEAPAPRLAPPPWTPATEATAAQPDRAIRTRFDNILAQLDRIPDLAAPADPLAWDEHGLPR